jgi:predicted transcriptional regulator
MRTTVKDLPYLPDDEHIEAYEKSVLAIAKRRVIKLLYKSPKSLSLMEIIDATQISVNSLAAIYSELAENRLIEEDNKRYFLTRHGQRWAVKNRKSIFMRKEIVIYKGLREFDSCTKKRYSESMKLPRAYEFSTFDIELAIR